MKLRNEFTVHATQDLAWPVLLDIPRVAACLPGAALEPSGGDGTFRGTMKVKLGPLTTTYEGTVALEEIDEDNHAASLSVRAHELKGQGAASATITSQLEPTADGTRVVIETDLSVTGRPAQFGRGLLEEVAGSILDEFATQIERELTASEQQSQIGSDQPLELGRIARLAATRRYGRGLATLAVAIALAAAFLRKHRHASGYW